MASIRHRTTNVLNKKKTLIIALCNEYAALAEKRFRQKQPSGTGVTGEFWTNQTSTAADTVFSGVFVSRHIYGFFLAQAVEYGVYLELANDRKHAALLPTVMAFYARFFRDLQEIVG